MKIFSRTTLKFSVFLSLFLCFGQTLSAQENKCDQPDSIREKLECSYQKILDNHRSDDPEKLKIALEAAKDYVKICENESEIICDLLLVQYFKDSIPILEKAIKSKSALSSRENECIQPVSLSEILKQFRFTSRKVKSVQQINDELISEIVKRKIGFEPGVNDRKTLKDAGANEMLLRAIGENSSEENKIKSDLYNRYITNFNSYSQNFEQAKEALEVAREYVRRFGNNKCDEELIAYFKEAITTLETVVEPHPPRRLDPKVELKWKLLSQVTEKFKAKNWNEVFVLGRKAYEVDPEFIPLITVLASLGHDQAKLFGNKSKYNAETVFYAELAVKLMENSKKDFPAYGGLGYPYKTKAEALEKMKEILDFMKTQNLYQANPETPK